ncbi:MerR family transcriptional regulator [Streptomyces sp. NPDC002550]
MRIGELAAQAGMTRDTIRFYEKVGLVAGRRLPNGYRDFPPETGAWLHYIRTAQALGFSLAEIARTGEKLREAPDTAEALSTLFEEKIQVIDNRIAELTTLRADLAARVGTGCPLRAADRPAGAEVRSDPVPTGVRRPNRSADRRGHARE